MLKKINNSGNDNKITKINLAKNWDNIKKRVEIALDAKKF